MKSIAIKLVLCLVLALAGSAGFAAPKGKAETKLKFCDVEYLHRWSKGDQHEFTPHNQEDLARWSDMITINHYRSVSDGEALAKTANAVLGTYMDNRAKVLRTDSVPRTPEKPAEHLIVVLLARPNFIEAVFARFKLIDGVGTAAIYSHREYGGKTGDQMSSWLKSNGPAIEKALMKWEDIPLLDASKN